ncbi:PPOX class F420-dependent oxidoreductase [Ktedonospora formicarum]|uniref:PPOX class F420-dependent oxidoreductase n=1 Tax=Ktedonospora formicarum TaxID=2778364 RepID=A0A8J3IB50_9CHLR|nr:PPOX class F420-dependent oxidoreductase [Ktedonospora formicarum]GHO49402.1 PPOX class F420-dependent oxidoreductase [Ktedonospora formicarum]
MSRFSEAELTYLKSQRLGRLATVNKHGEPQVAAVGFRYNSELDTIDIGGFNMSTSQKFRNIARNRMAAIVIDDVLPPWKTRSLEIRGLAEALSEGGSAFTQNFDPAIIRITPKRIIFWDSAAEPLISSKRDVVDDQA